MNNLREVPLGRVRMKLNRIIASCAYFCFRSFSTFFVKSLCGAGRSKIKDTSTTNFCLEQLLAGCNLVTCLISIFLLQSKRAGFSLALN